MATFKSSQTTNIETVPITKNSSDVVQGLLTAAIWDYTSPSSGQPAATDNIRLAQIPDGSRVLQTFFAWTAQVSTATGAIGITGTTAKYMAAQTLTSAGVKFAPTLIAESNLLAVGNAQSGNSMEESIITFATAGMNPSVLINGWFLYMY